MFGIPEFADIITSRYAVLYGPKNGRQVAYAGNSWPHAVQHYKEMRRESKSGLGAAGFQEVILAEQGEAMLRYNGCPEYLQYVDFPVDPQTRVDGRPS